MTDIQPAADSFVTAQLRVAQAVEYREQVYADTKPIRDAITAERAQANQAERDEKASFAKANPIGTTLPVMSDRIGSDGRRVRLGKVQVKQPPSKPFELVIDNEEKVIEWMISECGDDCVEQHLKEVYRRDALAMARAAIEKGEPIPEGIAIKAIPVGEPVVAWIPEPGAAAALADMARRGILPTPETLALEGPTA